MNGKMKVIDVDVHNDYKDELILAEYMPEPWRSRVLLHGVGVLGHGYWSPVGVKRRDCIPPSGGPAASDPEFLVQDLIEPFNMEYVILTSSEVFTIGSLHDPDYTAAVCSAYNDWVIDQWLPRHPSFKAAILVSTLDAELAAKEIDRLAGHPDFVEVLINSGARAPLGQRQFHPIYEAAHRNGLPVATHIGGEGTGFVLIEGTKYNVEKHNLIFVQPGQVHSFHYTPHSTLESYSIHCDLWWRPTEVGPCFTFHPEPPNMSLMTKIEPCRELSDLPVKSSLKSSPYLVEHFIQIVKSKESAYYQEEITSNLIYTFILRWYNSLNTLEPNDYRIVNIMEEMERYPERNLRYEQWCEKVKMGKSHFYKLFKKETGLTPKEYLLKMKMKKAALLLRESQQTITSIAEQLGYNSIHYFSKQFTAFYGLTPSSFRKSSYYDS